MDDSYRKQKVKEWYHEYSDDIYRFILYLTGDNEQAKDLMHDTFLKAYQHAASFQGKTSVKNWLYRIARNVTIDYMRKMKPIKYMLNSFAIFPSNDKCPAQISQLGENEEQLYKSIKKLKAPYQEVIILRKIKELSVQETAEILNWSESKVKTTLHRALQSLKEEMIKEGYTHDAI
ncbi:RNA polymerase sigma factor [Bacillus alkalisoli]|uniref:RNA polymerase sigma factor n=1 Tax=Bacillus alkalisoli TaxID=2011008 RepID=UPI001D0D3ABA|nr:RNA polymerase sigma factor [Bacillus alkalisoli]